MDLVRFLLEALVDLIRDTGINLSGRVFEEFFGEWRRRRKVKKRKKRKPG